jgi:hypothetical protein
MSYFFSHALNNLVLVHQFFFIVSHEDLGVLLTHYGPHTPLKLKDPCSCFSSPRGTEIRLVVSERLVDEITSFAAL